GEVGKGGIVRDAAQHRRVLVEMAEFCASIGLGVAGAMESPLTGARGNREFFLYLNCQTASCDSLERDIEEIFHGK
ncbi:MAG: TlyA family rRNA (cytidine-2'-O)-methyltransferase, partial [Acidobacteria bacterium]|nr:TlyA family rRNA (cytidine-2'-O)-methyltransferase [Acidobacteriota bacterium]